jgi:hypothetical protein
VSWSPYTYLPGGGQIYDPYDAYGHQYFIPGQAPIWTPPAYNPWFDPRYAPAAANQGGALPPAGAPAPRPLAPPIPIR